MAENKIGQFVTELRKGQKMTQKELASRLHITDKAVSKWERGLSYPDISLLTSLSEILGVTTSELLNGERSTAPHADVNTCVDNALEYAQKSETGKIVSYQNIWAITFSLLMFIGAVVCAICDLAMSQKFTWSLYPISSILFAWIVFFPLIKNGKKGFRGSLVVLSISVIPFLYVINKLIDGTSIMPIGISTAMLSIVYLWCVYFIFYKRKARKWRAGGLSLLLSVLLCLAINAVIAKILSQSLFNFWNMISCATLIISAVSLFVVDYMTTRRL